MINHLLRYLEIQPGEKRNFGILFLQTLLQGFGTSFFFVSATSHFVKYAGVNNLPFAYVLSGLVGVVLVGLYRRMQASAGIVFSYTTALIVYASFCALLYAGFVVGVPSQERLVFLGYAGLVLIMPFTAIFTLGFSLLSLQVFSFSQSKRLLALVGTGETIAAIIAFVSVPFLLKLAGNPVHFLPVSAVLVLMGLIPVKQLVSSNQGKLGTAIKVPRRKTTFNLAFFRKDRFFTAILLFTFFSVLAVYLADYGYLVAVRYFSVQTEIETATVVAVIFSVLKTGELVFSFLSRSIQSRYGMRISLLLLPCLLLLFSIFASAAYVLRADALFILFFLIINKFNERVIRKGITTPALKVVYQASPPAERAQLQTSIEGSFSQIATILGGALLMLVSLVYGGAAPDVLQLLNMVSVICIVVYLGWVFVSLEVFARYRHKINDFLFSAKNLNQSSGVRSNIPGEDLRFSLDAVPPVDTTNSRSVLQTVLYYNPSLKDYVNEFDIDSAMFFKRLERIYFNNDNFFSRVAVIWTVGFFPADTQLRFFRDVYHISNQEQRLLLVDMLNKAAIGSDQAYHFYFTSLIQDAVRDAMVIEGGIHDLSAADHPELEEQLERLFRQQKNIVLGLLRRVYAPDAIDAIHSVVNQAESSDEQQQFAVELLSNILKPGVKEYVLPLFDAVGYQQKKSKLGSLFCVYELPAAERLFDIVMSDVKLFDPYTRQLALQAYYSLTGDTKLVQAFHSSWWMNLRQLAVALLSTEPQDKSANVSPVAQETLLSGMANFLQSYYTTFRHETEQVINGRPHKVDQSGLAILYALQKQQ